MTEYRLRVLSSHLQPNPASMSTARSQRSPITTHVLDTALGKPAKRVPVKFEVLSEDSSQWILKASSETDGDGRCSNLLSPQELPTGTYRVTFDTKTYFTAQRVKCFYPYVQIVFNLDSPQEHHHIPLLLSPYSYTTYRGS